MARLKRPRLSVDDELAVFAIVLFWFVVWCVR